MVAMNDVRELADHIAQEFRPERIILFGSHAYGQAHQESDVDLLVVMPDDGNPVRKAAEIRARLRPNFPVDVIVRDPHVLRWRIEQNDWFLIEVTRRGKVLYEAPHG